MLSTICFNLVQSEILLSGNGLTLYQMTILNWSKLKAFADDKINLNDKTCFGKGRKHCCKRRNCWLAAISPFPRLFSKALSFRVVKAGIVW